MRARSDLPKSRWFKRGWTLQELLVPTHVFFYNRHWTYITSRKEIGVLLEEVTGISRDIFTGESWVRLCSVATKMSWAARRKTTRVEDEAYCLLGLFGIKMPLLYGEGAQAFQRLQHEILRTLTAPTAFAPSPRAFRRSTNVLPAYQALPSLAKKPFFLTNIGLHISLNLFRTAGGTFAVLPVGDTRGWLLGIPLEGLDHVAHLRDVADGTTVARKAHHQPLALLRPTSHHVAGLVIKSLTMVDVVPMHQPIRKNWSITGNRPAWFRLELSYDDNIDVIEHYCPALRAYRRLDQQRRRLTFHGFLRQALFRMGKSSGPWATIYFRARVTKTKGTGRPSEEFV